MLAGLRVVVTEWREQLALTLTGLLLGCAAGACCALFGHVLLGLSGLREAQPLLIVGLPVAGAFCAWVLMRFGNGAERGMSTVFETALNESPNIPRRLAPFVCVGTWLTHLCGGSAGREGVAVQLGAVFGDISSRIFFRSHSKSILVIAGMAAGFSGLFRTPLGAFFFALEVVATGKLQMRALAPSLAASYAAFMISGALGLTHTSATPVAIVWNDPFTCARLVALGIVFGVAGGGFAFALRHAKRLAKTWFPNPVLRSAALGAVIALLIAVIFNERYAGLGLNLITSALTDPHNVLGCDWIFKAALTILTIAAGYLGGEVTPLFAVGSTLGVTVAPLLGVDPVLAAALGYAAVFGAATNTMIAPAIMGAEVFGFAHTPELLIVCFVARLVSRHHSIYDNQHSIVPAAIPTTEDSTS